MCIRDRLQYDSEALRGKLKKAGFLKMCIRDRTVARVVCKLS